MDEDRAALIAWLAESETNRQAFVQEHVRGIKAQIRHLREQRGWSQRRLANAAGLHTRTILSAEDDRAKLPSIQALKAIARAFDVALDIRFMAFSAALGLPGVTAGVPSWEEEVAAGVFEGAGVETD